jgi:hypothetical protein
MANSLNRELKGGDKVVMSDGQTYIVDEAKTFGCYPFTSGRKFGIRLPGSEELIVASAMEIDADQTMERYAVENRWLLDAVEKATS